MTVLQWIKHPVDGDFAKALRRGIRMNRREKGRGGHRFIYGDLKTLWGSGDNYAILIHDTDRYWQFWWRHPERGWFLQSWHRLLSEAKEEAESPRILEVPNSPTPGTYVCAEWKEPYRGKAPMMVRCHTEYTTKEIRDVFERLGCATSIKAVV